MEDRRESRIESDRPDALDEHVIEAEFSGRDADPDANAEGVEPGQVDEQGALLFEENRVSSLMTAPPEAGGELALKAQPGPELDLPVSTPERDFFLREAAARAEALAKGANDIAAPLARWFTEDEAQVRDQVAGWLRGVNLRGYAAAYRAFATGDATYADAWPRITCPALILTGTHDANSTPEMAQAMAGAAPRGRAVILQNQRHMMNLTAPSAVSAALLDWLATPLALKDGQPLKDGHPIKEGLRA